MHYCTEARLKINITNLSEVEKTRYFNPEDINLPPGYRIEVYASGLDAPTSMEFTEDGSLLIAESGLISQTPQVLSLRDGQFKVIAEGFRTPISGVTYYKGDVYVAHRGYITMVRADGTIQNVLSGLPSNGDFGNSKVVFGPDGKMYFGQGTTTNSGVVGQDNAWVSDRPFLHDNPGTYVMLRGQNFATTNTMALGPEIIYTGAFSPYGETNDPHEVRKGVVKASGSIMRANPDGTNLEMMVWGLRFPTKVRFDQHNQLFATNIGFENRGSRPIVNAPDEFLMINPGIWYGWPDFAGGEPVTNSRFQPEGGQPLEFLLVNHPNIPPRPLAAFPMESNIMGFDFDYGDFGPFGHAYIAEFGSSSHVMDGEVTPYASYGHRISKVDMSSGGITTFAINKSGFSASITQEGGLSRPIDVLFGPDNAMYVLDMGLSPIYNPNQYYPQTGVIWRISKI